MKKTIMKFNKRSKKKPKEFAEDVKEFADEVTAKMKVQLEKLRFEPTQIGDIHQNIRRMTNQFDIPGPEMKRIIDFNIDQDDEAVPVRSVSYTHLRAHETEADLVCRLLLEKKK